MKKKPTKMISFRIDPNEYNLSALETRILVTKGKELFTYLMNTIDSKKFLEDNPDLNKVIDKW